MDEYFQDVEIEHDLTTYFATGKVIRTMREAIGGSFENYSFENLSESETHSIEIEELYYIDEDLNDAVQVLGKYKYKEVEQLAREALADMYN